jgi:hypothetical protein
LERNPGAGKIPHGGTRMRSKTRGRLARDQRGTRAGPETPAAAKVTAARTLAEIEGLIGRHQAAPRNETASLSILSRDDLIAELERLRTLIDLGLVP